jgi:fumarate reductase subunit C
MKRDGEGIPLTGPSGRAYPRRRAGNDGYTRYHPRWYRRRMPIFWWLGKPAYTGFIVRELTSLFVAYAAGALVLFVGVVGAGPEAYEAFLGRLSHPAVLAFHAFVLLALLVHAVTWLNLAPKALVIRVGGRRLPDGAVVAGHYAAWVVLSAVIAWVMLGRGG